MESYKEEIEILFVPSSLLNRRENFLFFNLVGSSLSPPTPVLQWRPPNLAAQSVVSRLAASVPRG